MSQRETEHEETIASLKKALAKHEALFREVTHRVTNSFHVVSTRMRAQARNLSDPVSRQLCVRMAEHVEAMALVHRRLYEGENPAEQDIGQYLCALCDDLAASTVTNDVTISCTEEGQAYVGPDIAVTIGMIVAELVVNSTKYAFGERTQGHIDVLIRCLDDTINLKVSDNGIGLPANFDIDKTAGFGMRLVSRQARTLGGAFTYESTNVGTAFHVSFPVPIKDDGRQEG